MESGIDVSEISVLSEAEMEVVGAAGHIYQADRVYRK
jgi:hypothetical protein